MNRFRELLEKLEAKTDRTPSDDTLLEMMRKKLEELGEDPTDEAAEEALRQVIKDHLMLSLEQKVRETIREEKAGNSGEDHTAEELAEEIETVRKVFRDMDLHFWDHPHQTGVHAFELGIRENGKQLRLKIYLEASPKVCRIDAVYPFTADREFAYPLCEKLVEENYPRRYGALQYDAKDGELSYRYSFPITHGLHRDDFRVIFLTILKSAYHSYETVRLYSTGRFRKETRQEISQKARQLLEELEA